MKRKLKPLYILTLLPIPERRSLLARRSFSHIAGARVALKEINRRRDLLPGYCFEMIVEITRRECVYNPLHLTSTGLDNYGEVYSESIMPSSCCCQWTVCHAIYKHPSYLTCMLPKSTDLTWSTLQQEGCSLHCEKPTSNFMSVLFMNLPRLPLEFCWFWNYTETH